MEIMAGLNSSVVMRLRKSWEVVFLPSNYPEPLATLLSFYFSLTVRVCDLQIVEKDEIHSVKLALEDLISHLQSYKNYRRALHTAAPPCVPYLGNIYINIISCPYGLLG